MNPRAHVKIRPVIESDRRFVFDQICHALKPFYGGDHVAHARRIFETAIQGGFDKKGYFSIEQRMFIATIKKRRVGLIHIVSKRQGTCKISPIVVARGSRRGGIGYALLKFAERYADRKKARQIYCTVTESNTSALSFFIDNGYIIAGKSRDQYMAGQTEVMIYKPLETEWEHDSRDPLISVLPMTQSDAKDVEQLLLQRLPSSFAGIDKNWVRALFAGYSRRSTNDVNEKFKLIYVASDRRMKILGVVAASPKKGRPIKLMPFIATNMNAFIALLTDVPSMAGQYGDKLFIHISPTARQTLALQERGWTLVAAMPNAYKNGTVTQEWTYDVSDETVIRTLRIAPDLLNPIASGQKTIEIRVGYPDTIKKIRPRDKVLLQTHRDILMATVRDVRKYRTLDLALRGEDYKRIIPGRSYASVLHRLKTIYPPSKEKLGVYAIEFEKVERGKTAPVSEFSTVRRMPRDAKRLQVSKLNA